MLDLAAVQAAFPELTDLVPNSRDSGQKEVVFAKHKGDDVVLKLIKGGPQGGDDRATREIEAVATLACDYVPPVLSHGRRKIGTEDRLFIIEKRITGMTFRAALDAKPKRDAREVITFLETLLSACKAFEDAKLVHRDIKPDNLLVDATGKLWIIDFGLVRFLDQTSLTPTGQHFGPFSPGYGAPEQMRNLKPQISSRADLFSIGVVAYEMLNGGNPHLTGRDVLVVINNVLKHDLPPLTIPGDASNELSQFIAALTARFPSRRPKTAAEALAWLRSIQAGGATSNTKEPN